MTNSRFCVFCGERPENKNREHILPQWLIQLTGDPKRTVNFGTHYKNNRTIRFDWSSFCAPSCENCNSEYSNLEGRAKSYILTILERGSLTSFEYSDLMDWLDKVRVGLWLTYHHIQGNPTNISPSFHINTRISKKDRAIAIYPIEGEHQELNAFGVESLVFHRHPSCFGLRINNILILSISSDYLISGRCGFPYPERCETWLDGPNAYMLEASNFKLTRKIKHPLLRRTIIKPSIHLYQPIMLEIADPRFQSGFIGDYNLFDSFLDNHTLPPYPTGKGVLFFQHLDRVEPILNPNRPIAFENCIGIHSRPMIDLVKQIYELQNYIYNLYTYSAFDPEKLKSHNRIRKLIINRNKEIIKNYSSMKTTH